MKLLAPAFAEAASRRQAQGGASGRCRHDFTGSALLPAHKAGHPADLPAKGEEL